MINKVKELIDRFIQHEYNCNKSEFIRTITDENIYACYVSYDQKSNNPIDYNKKYYAAQTNEGLKIIYDLTFYSDEGGWAHPVDMDTVKVLGEGELVAIEKYKAPEEATSLAAYNKE